MFRVLKWLIAFVLTVGAAVGAVILLTTYDELTATLPTIDRLLEYDPPVATRVYANDGSLIEEFYRERRYRVAIGDIPPIVRNAFLASEDSDFFAHHGVDFVGIVRAAIVNFRAGDVVQGASTITQQVVKALLLTPERSYERKLKEILLSLRLEQHLTKEEILALYLNQIYFGDGNHGVGAAARNYFGKSVQDLTVAEAALLAGLPAAPSRYSPNRDPEAARKRQHYVLRRMLEERFLGAGEYQAALREQVHVLARHQKASSVRNYYTETVRLQLETMFGAEAPYNQGYTVHTAMDPRLQTLAEVAVRNGIERIDQALGYRGPLAHVSEAEGRTRIEAMKNQMAGAPPDPERLYEAFVTRVSPGKLDVTVGAYQITVETAKVRWSSSVKTRSFRAGDVVEVRTREVATSQPGPREAGEGENASPRFYLGQTPQIEAALVAIDIDKGGIVALVGGYDFLGSQFNRALQAMRQPGSAFKPFVYAAALDNGFTAASILQDSPVEYMDNDKLWQPRNYTRDYKGPIRLRTALEQSRNVVSVKLVDSVGVKTVVDYLARFRLNANFGANLSIGLGTTELTLKDLTEGYTAFANGGIKVEPVIIRRIEDKDGRAFFTDEPRRRETLSPDTAALMTYILRGVIDRGTATSVQALERPAAGKTGTTNEQRDAWFVGYTPNLAVGVWVGFDDQNQTMGKMGTGGRVAAPIWMDFMKPALAGTPVRDFEIPEDISCVNIDPATGRRAREWTDKPFLECFKEGTEPGAYEYDSATSVQDETATRGPSSSPTDTAPGQALDPEAPRDFDPRDPRDPRDPEKPRALHDPRWPSERDSESPTADRWSWPPSRLPPVAPAPPVAPGYAPPPPNAYPPTYRPAYPRDHPAYRAPEPPPQPAPERYKARAVPTENGGTEVRLYRDSEDAAPAPPAVEPERVPLPPGATVPASPRASEERLWGAPAQP